MLQSTRSCRPTYGYLPVVESLQTGATTAKVQLVEISRHKHARAPSGPVSRPMTDNDALRIELHPDIEQLGEVTGQTLMMNPRDLITSKAAMRTHSLHLTCLRQLMHGQAPRAALLLVSTMGHNRRKMKCKEEYCCQSCGTG